MPAGKANPSPPIGPALGQRDINIMEFCKAFNAKSGDMEPGAPCPTIITYYQDKSFTLEIKTPPASYFLKKAAKLKGGGKISVRGPLRPDEEPTVRPYRLVDDIEAALEEAKDVGAEVAMPATPLPGHGTFAIYIHGGIEHGLWLREKKD